MTGLAGGAGLSCPKRVDRVVSVRDQLGAGLIRSLMQLARAGDGVQPRIEPEPLAGFSGFL